MTPYFNSPIEIKGNRVNPGSRRYGIYCVWEGKVGCATLESSDSMASTYPDPQSATMALTPEDVHKIAHLARLAIDEDQVEAYADNLSAILAFVDQMNAVDTTGVVPMAHPLDAVQRLRPDEVTETDQRGKFQAIAPKAEEGLYLVPRVIE